MTPWQEQQVYGAAYPATINPDFAAWRPLIEALARNNENRRQYCRT